MCIIVDADRMSIFLADPEHSDAAPIHTWLRRGRGKLVYSTGDKFRCELRGRATKERLAALVQAGQARFLPPSSVEEQERQLKAEGVCRSNDRHVLALARASGTRLLFTGDAALQTDFKDRKILANPRGRIYSGARNRQLLNSTICRQ